MMCPVYQNSNASFCIVGGASIFLDRKNDQYHYLGQEQTQALSALEKRRLAEENAFTPDTDSNLDNAVNHLISKNLLTRQQECGLPLQQATHHAPKSSVYNTYWKRRLSIYVITSLTAHYLWLRRRFRRESFFEITTRAERLKSKSIQKPSPSSASIVTDMARKMIDARYTIYTYTDRCFFDSYLFFTFFQKRHIPVNWVFGVDLCPFQAHCWVEYDGIVLNDQLDRVAAFTPIYVI